MMGFAQAGPCRLKEENEWRMIEEGKGISRECRQAPRFRLLPLAPESAECTPYMDSSSYTLHNKSLLGRCTDLYAYRVPEGV